MRVAGGDPIVCLLGVVDGGTVVGVVGMVESGVVGVVEVVGSSAVVVIGIVKLGGIRMADMGAAITDCTFAAVATEGPFGFVEHPRENLWQHQDFFNLDHPISQLTRPAWQFMGQPTSIFSQHQFFFCSDQFCSNSG